MGDNRYLFWQCETHLSETRGSLESRSTRTNRLNIAIDIFLHLNIFNIVAKKPAEK